MRVKRFVASDIQEAMAKIKSEMGTDAVILHTRYFKEGGILGLFKKNYVEVTAAADSGSDTRPGKTNAAPGTQGGRSILPPARRPAENLAREAEPEAIQAGYELDEMKKVMSEMSRLIENTGHISRFPKLGQNLFARLKKQGVDEKIAVKTVKATMQELALHANIPDEQVNSIFFNNLLKPIKNKSKPVVFDRSRYRIPKVYAMVGPTGVGKTTTIAKLAAMYAIVEMKKISFVTVDTYRIAAPEQLKTIGEIMNVPVSVVYSLNQLKECLMEISDSDIIFIDTAGRSHKNALHIEELHNYLEIANPDEVFLALSATSKYQDLLQILDVYQDLGITRLIFTKLDETSFFGPLYNIACKTKYPLSYFTIGQNIPDDIEIADPIKLVQMLIKE
ncbi:MAG: flagellar biosynthesis protein FlhF [Peptococcaceae bacterium]|jgi:flagellar biosynthesis protein FlhF|nr:flagellar biosynthesis protein FlhF [Peptococcaceae bacterium]MDH7524055.1 flagellar biosynthesis protein FlhF [Peptococcaceae bacterium]